MEQFYALAIAAILVEAVVSFIDNIKEKETEWKYWVSLVAGLGIAILVAVNYDVDIFEFIGFESKLPYVGAVLSAVIIARGSNYVADLLLLVNGARQRLNGNS